MSNSNNYYHTTTFETDLQPLRDLADEFLSPEKYAQAAQGEFLEAGCFEITRTDTEFKFTGEDFIENTYTEALGSDGSPISLCVLRLTDIPIDLTGLAVIPELCEFFKNTTHHHDPDYLIKYLYFFSIRGPLPKHTDARLATFNIPVIMGENTPMTWHDLDKDDEVVCEYTYQGKAALVNTYVRHANLTNTGHRLFLSVGGWRESFDTVKEQLEGL